MEAIDKIEAKAENKIKGRKAILQCEIISIATPADVITQDFSGFPLFRA